MDVSEVKTPEGVSFVQDTGALKKADIEGRPVAITGCGETRQGQFGASAIADFEYLDGPETGTERGVYVDGRFIALFQTHFATHKRKPIEGMWLKNPTIDGQTYRGWQFVSLKLQMDIDGTYKTSQPAEAVTA